MNPVWQLILGYLGLSATITYAWWSHVRVFILQADLHAIGNDLASISDHRGRGTEPDVRSFLDALDDLIEAVPTLSPAIIGPISRLPGVELAGFLGTGPEPFFDLLLDPRPKAPELTVALWKVALRLGRYLALETFSGWLSIAKVMIFGLNDPALLPGDADPAARDSIEVQAIASLLSRGQYRRTA